MRVQLLLTGNEIMAGDTIDSNSSRIALQLKELGVPVYRRVTIGDDPGLLVDEIRQLSTGSDLLIVNGGLGPTVDDLTAEALAEACGTEIVEHPDALAHLQDWCQRRGFAINKANYKQTMLPEGCDIVPNPNGSAVGFRVVLNNCMIICTPGVPSELSHMLEHAIIPLIREHFTVERAHSVRRIRLFGLGESALQQLIDDNFPDWPAEVMLGFRANLPILELKLEVEGEDRLALRDQWEKNILDLIGDYVIGENDDELPGVVVRELARQSIKITLAESCTGGRIAAQLTSVPGASAVFEAGFVTYADSIKHSQLGVGTDILEQHGAVSEPVVLEMAEGALDRSGADLAVAVSGIAGPDGGTDEKPVGTVWIAWGRRGELQTRKMRYRVGRELFQVLVTATALDLVRRTLFAITAEPRYFRDRKA
jgi:nicotinamide-nucleotide amidase